MHPDDAQTANREAPRYAAAAGRPHEEVHHRRAGKPSPAHQGGMRIARGEDGRLPARDAGKALPAETVTLIANCGIIAKAG